MIDGYGGLIDDDIPDSSNNGMPLRGNSSNPAETSLLSPSQAPQESNPGPWNKITDRDKYNYFSRWVELNKSVGASGRILYDTTAEQHANLDDLRADGEVNNELEIGLIFSNGGGLLVGLLFHWFCLHYNLYQNNKSLNPLFRTFKTLASVGAALGNSIAVFLPLPDGAKKFFAAILTDILCLAIGLIAFPYWLLRQYYFKISHKDDKENDKQKNTDHIIGTEGWSKYGKTLLVFGISIGQFLAITIALCFHYSSNAIKAASALWSGLAGAGLFGLGLILIPVINRLFKDKDNLGALKLKDNERNKFRTNYIRSGMTLGLGLGTFLGAMTGFLLPSLFGIDIGMILGGAILSIIGGVVAGYKGGKLTSYFEKPENQWNIESNTENAWDYATRTTSFIGGAIGTLIGFCLPIPGGFLAGSAIGAVIGWFAAFPILKKARELEPIEKKSTLLPWTQRIATGMNLGTVIGGIIGLVAGILGGPLGLIGGAVVGSAMGSLVGGGVAAFLGPQSSAAMKKMFPSFFPSPETTDKIAMTSTSTAHIRRATPDLAAPNPAVHDHQPISFKSFRPSPLNSTLFKPANAIQFERKETAAKQFLEQSNCDREAVSPC